MQHPIFSWHRGIRLLTLLCCFCMTQYHWAYSQTEQTLPSALDVMPLPARIDLHDGSFVLTTSLTVGIAHAEKLRSVSLHQLPLSPLPTRQYSAATRLLRAWSDRTGLVLQQGIITPQDSLARADLSGSVIAPRIVIAVERRGVARLHEDESYRMSITPTLISITASTDIGAVRACATLVQMLRVRAGKYEVPCAVIEDTPRYAWRGLSLDIARHFLSPDHIKRTIEGMTLVKLNVLHLHLSDDQGFRMESQVYPRLHQFGADGQYVTQEQMRDLIRFCDERGIRVVPEFDVPGHSASWLAGHPELGVPLQAEGAMHRKFGRNAPLMAPSRDTLYTFLEQFFTEMTRLFPDEYFHIGGDEVFGKQWKDSEEIQEWMKREGLKSKDEAQKFFNKKILATLTRLNKKMIGWDEIFQPGLPSNIAIQSWQGNKALLRGAKEGYDVLLSGGYYLDLHFKASVHYGVDPMPDSAKLTASERKRILGGEATIWTEMMTPENVDSRVWPRLAVVAERLWSPVNIRDTNDMYRRLDGISSRLEEDYKLTHRTNYALSLRRLTNGYEIAPLKTLADICEPIKEYKRQSAIYNDYTVFYPLTHLVDATRADAPEARNVMITVRRFIKDRNRIDYRILMSLFAQWAQSPRDMEFLILKSPRLQSLQDLANNVGALGVLGMQAIDALMNSTPQPPDWHSTAQQALKKSAQPIAFCELAVLPSLKELFDAVGQ